MNSEAIQRVAQNMPSHMLQSLSAVANQTPHYPHTPGGAYGAAAGYINTPYTPSGQTPFMTPYQTPAPSTTPRYGQPPQVNPFLHPGMVTPSQHRTVRQSPQISQMSTSPSPRQLTSPYIGRGGYDKSMSSAETDWQKAAEAWARQKNRDIGHGTPRTEGRNTPRGVSQRTPRYDAISYCGIVNDVNVVLGTMIYVELRIMIWNRCIVIVVVKILVNHRDR